MLSLQPHCACCVCCFPHLFKPKNFTISACRTACASVDSDEQPLPLKLQVCWPDRQALLPLLLSPAAAAAAAVRGLPNPPNNPRKTNGDDGLLC
jgi:hypothetical protein